MQFKTYFLKNILHKYTFGGILDNIDIRIRKAGKKRLMKPKIFIDGKEGTTGIQIYERLGNRKDIELLVLPDEERKDLLRRKEMINEAEVVFLCLPDDAARESVSLVENDWTKIIDASTAHRTDSQWVYGFPELSLEQRSAIAETKRLANPGCHATGFISIVGALVRMGVLPEDYPLTCHSLTGYSGGGKKMIAEYEGENRSDALNATRIYGIGLNHKHIPEMMYMSGMKRKPVFCPILGDYYAGMATVIPLQNDLLKGELKAKDIHEMMAEYYKDAHFVEVTPFMGEGRIDSRGFIESNACIGTNRLEILVCGNQEQTMIVSRFDNLGKGASGAAVQNMNIMLGLDEKTGLE